MYNGIKKGNDKWHIYTMGSQYTGPKEIEYLFIDGSYLSATIGKLSKEFYSGRTIPIDFQKLAGGHTKSFYYDCIKPRRKKESEKDFLKREEDQQEQFNAIRMINGYHVYEGVTKGKVGQQRQKQVDVKIAVDMLSHSHRRNMHKATLLTGDLDFKPLVEALIDDGMYVTLWYDPSSTSKELMYTVDAR